jgi:hypothetical protein
MRLVSLTIMARSLDTSSLHVEPQPEPRNERLEANRAPADLVGPVTRFTGPIRAENPVNTGLKWSGANKTGNYVFPAKIIPLPSKRDRQRR